MGAPAGQDRREELGGGAAPRGRGRRAAGPPQRGVPGETAVDPLQGPSERQPQLRLPRAAGGHVPAVRARSHGRVPQLLHGPRVRAGHAPQGRPAAQGHQGAAHHQRPLGPADRDDAAQIGVGDVRPRERAPALRRAGGVPQGPAGVQALGRAAHRAGANAAPVERLPRRAHVHRPGEVRQRFLGSRAGRGAEGRAAPVLRPEVRRARPGGAPPLRFRG
mmetsp:Transcript_12779/g.36118  ORF Transcript_12779/g.36118 Transcript_12779/m.36118 type:complete len:219 (-) Transcript_12779:1247-1903(-)